MTITAVEPPGSLTQKLEFLKPFKDECLVHFTIAPESGGSRVTWAIDGNYNFVSKVMCLFVSMDKMMGKDFEAGLASLKQVAERSNTSMGTVVQVARFHKIDPVTLEDTE